MKPEVSVVWLKRDIRISDHAALFYAIKQKLPVIILYCFEPSLRNYYDWDVRHWRFVYQSLLDLSLKIPVLWNYGEVISTFEILKESFDIKYVYSHQETGTQITYDRDKNFFKWCKNQNITWKQYQSGGVIRGLKNRKEWKRLWVSHMRRIPFQIDLNKVHHPDTSKILLNHNLPEEVMNSHKCFQKGGETEGRKILHDFLDHRHFDYLKNIYKHLRDS